jgi:hypothetical protein
MSEGYLYCFSNESMPGILKIGMTERTPELRLNEANGSDTWKPPTPYKIEFAKKVLNPKQQETMIHKLLEQYTERINPKREFFRISVEKARIFFDLIDDDLLEEQEENVDVEEEDEEDFEDVDEEVEDDDELTIECNESFNKGEQINLKTEEKQSRFFCKNCNYQTSQKSHFKKHLLTSKHIKIFLPKTKRTETYICKKCNRTYKHSSSLSFHKKNCENSKEDISSNKCIILHLIKENNGLKEILIEQSRVNKQIIQKNQEETKNMLLEMMKSNNLDNIIKSNI